MKKLSTLLLVSLMVLASACSKPEEQPAGACTAGTYSATEQGFGGEITVEVTVSENAIESVVITGEGETAGIGSAAVDTLDDDILAAQSVDVDVVGGATVSSTAILTAAKAALEQGCDLTKLVASEGNDKETQDKTIDTDVVVIGAGGAGLTAAIEAKNAGKNVVILEKTAMTGGNTTRSTGGMNAAETDFQDTNEFGETAGADKGIAAAEAYPELAELAATVKSQWDAYKANPEGYFDSIELFMLDTLVGGKNLNNYDLVKTLAENSAEGITWLAENADAHLTNVGSFGGASVKRIHRPVDGEGKTVSVGAYIIPKLTAAVENLGIEILFETPATELITKDGAVVGVIAKNGDATVTVNAKSVVIATGGFGANLEMVSELKPELDGFVTTNAPGIDGDGIAMATAIGAATVDMDQIQIHPTVEQATSGLITEGLRGDGAILVNQEGLRFCDEVGTRDAVSAAELAQTGGYAYLIVDQAMVDKSSVIAGYIKKGYTVQGDDYAALATAIGADAEAFTNTMNTWNTCVETKTDAEFGRTSFAQKLDTAPYYAIKIAPGVHHTMGGLQINTNTEVLDTNGAVISGLYAAGEVTGGVHGANRLGGNAVADIVVFGRIAGQQAAAHAE